MNVALTVPPPVQSPARTARLRTSILCTAGSLGVAALVASGRSLFVRALLLLVGATFGAWASSTSRRSAAAEVGRSPRRVMKGSCLALVAVAIAPALSWPAGAATTLSSPGLPATWQRGAAIASWWYNELESTTSDAAITSLKATGSTDVAFVATWYMASPTASSIAPSALKTPTDAGLLRAMAKARSLGMRAVLKVHVDVADGSFRGYIAPTSPTVWFASYTTMVQKYADLARQANADMFVVGTELSSMSGYTAQWKSVIAAARARFAGKMTFAANWIDGARQVAFWDALDYIGIDAYMPLASSTNPNPSVDELTAAWTTRGYINDISQLQAQWAKPVIFTELGYQSQSGTAVTPWYTWGALVSQDAQQKAYEAAYRAWAGISWFRGIYWWDWSPGGFNALDGSFNPRGKLAESTMKAWNTGAYAGSVTTTTVPPTTTTAPATTTTVPATTTTTVRPTTTTTTIHHLY